MPLKRSKRARTGSRVPASTNGEPARRQRRRGAGKTRGCASGGGAAKRKRPPAAGLPRLFPNLAAAENQYGVAVLVAIAERWGAEGELHCTRQEALFPRPGLPPKTALLDRARPEVLARMLSGFAHPDRIRLARAVLTGANTHHLLADASRLKTGPLYHHLRELERAGLLARTARNAYAITDFGRIALFVTAVLGMNANRHNGQDWKTERFTSDRVNQRKTRRLDLGAAQSDGRFR